MTREETKDILDVVFNAYPAFKKTKIDELKKLVDLWAAALTDTSYKEAYDNLVHFIKNDTKGFAPPVACLITHGAKTYGFEGRAYSHEFFEELERENARMYRV